MKISKTFRLSPEAIEKLMKQDNATQYLEDLILGNTPQESQRKIPWGNLEKRIDDMQNKIISKVESINIKQNDDGTISPIDPTKPAVYRVTETKKTASATRSRGDIINDIKTLEAEKMEMVSQDPDDYIGINKNIADLWKEYHAQDSN